VLQQASDELERLIDVTEGLEQGATRAFSFSRTFNDAGHYVITAHRQQHTR
jgi:hypothetical protein